MLPSDGHQQPKCLQVYFYDDEDQADMRASLFNETNQDGAALANNYARDREIFHMLHQSLLQCRNTYLYDFLTINEHVQLRGLDPTEVRIVLHAQEKPQSGHHRGRYELPTTSEIGFLMPNTIHSSEKRTLICSVRGQRGENGIQFLSDTHHSYDPLQYPCFFPMGTDG